MASHVFNPRHTGYAGQAGSRRVADIGHTPSDVFLRPDRGEGGIQRDGAVAPNCS